MTPRSRPMHHPTEQAHYTVSFNFVQLRFCFTPLQGVSRCACLSGVKHRVLTACSRTTVRSWLRTLTEERGVDGLTGGSLS